MSFKTRIIDYCENKKVNCISCPFQKPCDWVDDTTIPKYFTDGKMKQFEEGVNVYKRQLSDKLKEVANLMNKAAMDDVMEHLDTILEGGQDE